MWEFIGGKAEPGETRELALIHEGIPRNLEHYETRRIAVHEIEQYTFKENLEEAREGGGYQSTPAQYVYRLLKNPAEY